MRARPRDGCTATGVLCEDLNGARRRVDDELGGDADVGASRRSSREPVLAALAERDLLRTHARRDLPGVAVRVRLDDRTVLEPQRARHLDCRGQEIGNAEESRDERRPRTFIELLGGPELLEPAAVHDGDGVGHRHGLLLVVRHVDEGDSELVLDALQEELHLLAQLEVERPERLVEQQHPRPADERAGQGHALLLPSGELLRLAVSEPRQLDQPQDVVDPLPDLFLGDALALEAKRDVVGDREVRKERVRLEHSVHIALVRRQPDHVVVAEEDAAGIRLLEAADHAQSRCLAAPGRAKQREEPALLDLEREIVHRDDVVEALRDALQPHVGDELRHGIRTPHSYTCLQSSR